MIHINLLQDNIDIKGDVDTIESEILFIIGAYYNIVEKQTNKRLSSKDIINDLDRKIQATRAFFNKDFHKSLNTQIHF